MGLQLYWTSLDQRFSFGEGGLSVPKIVQGSLVHDEFAIENNGYDGSSHGNVKGIPFTERLVCVNQWISPWRSGLSVVPQTARSLVGSKFPFSGFFRGVPNLDLRNAAQINSAVRSWNRFVVDHKLEVSIVFFSREIKPFTIVNQDTVFNSPMLLNVLEARFFLLLELFGR